MDRHELREKVEKYLKTGKPVNFVHGLLDKVRTPLSTEEKNALEHSIQEKNDLAKMNGQEISAGDPRSKTFKYNVPLLNALVLHIGVQAIANLADKSEKPSGSTASHTIPMELLQAFSVELDGEGRYHFFNSIANQLRYPNSHTHYFSCVLLYLFAEVGDEMIKEQITRVLLERLIVHRPHPWGLLITFIELIKNQRYNFWQHKFTHCADDIKQLFESVARSCMPNAQGGAGGQVGGPPPPQGGTIQQQGQQQLPPSQQVGPPQGVGVPGGK